MKVQSIDRPIRHRLAVLRYADEISMNVAATCRHYGNHPLDLFIPGKNATSQRVRRDYVSALKLPSSHPMPLTLKWWERLFIYDLPPSLVTSR